MQLLRLAELVDIARKNMNSNEFNVYSSEKINIDIDNRKEE